MVSVIASIRMTLDELRHDLTHMDSDELKAFGRLRRANPDSVEYRESRAEWQCRQAGKVDPETCRPDPVGPTSRELKEMAAIAGPGRYPWVRYQD